MSKFNELIAGQAKTGREVAGMIVKNLIDGKDYKVVSFNAETGDVTISEIVAEGEKGKLISVSPNQQKVLLYTFNPNEKPAPDATIVNGTLTVKTPDGERTVQMGTIKADRVVGGVLGKVLFLSGTALMSYDVQMDKFDTVVDSVDPEIVAFHVDKALYLVQNIYKDIPQNNADGTPALNADGTPVTKRRFERAVVGIYDGRWYNEEYGRNGEDYDDWEDEDEDSCESDSYRVTGVRKVTFGDRSAIVVTSDGLEAGHYEDDLSRPRVVVNGETIYTTTDAAKVYLGGANVRPTITVVAPDEIVLRDSYGFKVVKDAEIISALEGYTAFIGEEARQTENGTEVIVTYANSDYDTKSFKVTKTVDRGDIYELL